jgi:hypothetical protein
MGVQEWRKVRRVDCCSEAGNMRAQRIAAWWLVAPKMELKVGPVYDGR